MTHDTYFYYYSEFGRYQSKIVVGIRWAEFGERLFNTQTLTESNRNDDYYSGDFHFGDKSEQIKWDAFERVMGRLFNKIEWNHWVIE